MGFNVLFKIKLLLHLALILSMLFTTNSFARTNEVRVLTDISYGKSKEQTMDIYFPSIKRQDSPVIFMVHGGAWRMGDKASKAVIKNKVAHWVPKGFIFISVNYRMLPKIRPVEQADDVEKALLYSKRNAYKWGGSSDKIILMGHSAGAHLVSLISVRHDGLMPPWLGTIALDSAAYDIVQIMNSQSPPRFYKKAFGEAPEYWKKASPIHALTDKLSPFLAVCSSKRKDNSCSQARSFVEKAKKYGSYAQVLPVDFSHRSVNVKLGADYCYTRAVDEFIKKLSPDIESMFASQSTSRLWSWTQQRCTSH